MAFCRSCGARMQDTDHFCGKCGTAAHSSTAPPYGFHFTANMADETADFDLADIEANRTVAGFSYFIFFLPFILCPQSRYARFHANQGLLLFIFATLIGVLRGILSVGFGLFSGYGFLDVVWHGVWIIPNIISSLLGLLLLALWIVGLVNGFTGRARNLPVIGRFRLI